MKTLTQNIAEHRFFSDLEPEHLGLLAECSKEASFQPGHMMLREGEPASQFFLIRSGNVVLESRLHPRREIMIQRVGAGDVLGWSWLLAPFTWHFQARPIELTDAYVLDGAHLLVAAEENHAFGYEMMKRFSQILIKRLHETRQHLLQIQPTGVPAPVEPQSGTSPVHKLIATSSLKDAMAQHPFLKGLTPPQIQLLADVAMEVEFTEGQRIFQEGDPANRFYLIEHGRVALEARPPERGVVPIQTLTAGHVLGWSWLFPPYYWHFDARALEPTRAIFFYGTRLREECEQDPDLGYALMKRVTQVLINRLQATRRQILDSYSTQESVAVKG